MHGRLKVKTTEQQDAEKRKEREKKLSIYQSGCGLIQKKKEENELDDEALSVSTSLLLANPDFYTLWNFRKEILLHLKESKTEDEYQSNCITEMGLTESCLRKNPKSYGAWNHRYWALKETPNPQWNKEIELLNRFLELDERNFHCWNHRRVVCQFAKVQKNEELDFTMRKIEANFSNYSAWHYRSSLLPIVHPGPKEEFNSIEETVLLKEYELVQNAAFTDPSDQSAWFYHRWLLGRAEKKPGILFAYFNPSNNMLLVVLEKAIKLNGSSSLQLFSNEQIFHCEWKTPEDNSFASTIFFTYFERPLDTNFIMSVELTGENFKDCLVFETEQEIIKWKDSSKKLLYSSELSIATSQVLEMELESCQQLLQMEPENKWTLLTCVLLMQALDGQHYQKQVLGYLEKLNNVDASRVNYYNDLRSKYLIENHIVLAPPNLRTLSLTSQGLSSLYHLDHLATLKELDLSKNKIISLKNFGKLVCLEKLNLDSNLVESCDGLRSLKKLRELSLTNNNVTALKNLEDLKQCQSLERLNLVDNPLRDTICLADEINAWLGLPNLKYFCER